MYERESVSVRVCVSIYVRSSGLPFPQLGVREVPRPSPSRLPLHKHPVRKSVYVSVRDPSLGIELRRLCLRSVVVPTLGVDEASRSSVGPGVVGTGLPTVVLPKPGRGFHFV